MASAYLHPVCISVELPFRNIPAVGEALMTVLDRTFLQ